MGRGELSLRQERLSVEDEGIEVFGLALADLTLSFIEVKNALQVRDADKLYAVDCGTDSPMKWGHFLERWR